MDKKLIVRLRKPHDRQTEFIGHPAKRKIIRAGRRSGKTVGVAVLGVKAFLDGRRVLYAAPTSEQTDRFWYEVTRSLAEPTKAGIYHKNETEHFVELPGTEQRIKAKTAWNANTLRGDYADLLLLDEWQLMAEDTWEEVGAPMLLDNNGDAVFIYTPPSLHSSGVSKARDPRHASKLFKKAEEDKTGRWAAFHFASRENPHISVEALEDIAKDMSQLSYRQEILAEDVDEAWKGLIYRGFNHQACVIPRFPVNDEAHKNWPIYVGHDFGGANPAAMFYIQDPATGYFYAWKEYLPGAGRSTAQHVEEFKKITEGMTVIKRAGGSHQEEEIRQGYTAHGWPIQEPKIRDVKVGIDRVCALHELNKEYIFEDLYDYLFEQANYSWKLDEQGQPTNDIQSKEKFHLMDCRRYILSDFTPETVVGTRPRVVHGHRF